MSSIETIVAPAPVIPTGHLILTVRRDERVLLRIPGFGEVEVQLDRLDLGGDKVRLGFRAPLAVEILREKLAEKIPPGERLRRARPAA